MRQFENNKTIYLFATFFIKDPYKPAYGVRILKEYIYY